MNLRLSLAVLVLVMVACAKKPASTSAAEPRVSKMAAKTSSAEISVILRSSPNHPVRRVNDSGLCFSTLPPEGWVFTGASVVPEEGGTTINWGYMHDSGLIVDVQSAPWIDLDGEPATSQQIGRAAASTYDMWAPLGLEHVRFTSEATMQISTLSRELLLIRGGRSVPLGEVLSPVQLAEYAASLPRKERVEDKRLELVDVIVVGGDGDHLFILEASWPARVGALDQVLPKTTWAVLPCQAFEQASSTGSAPIVDVPEEGLPGEGAAKVSFDAFGL